MQRLVFIIIYPLFWIIASLPQKPFYWLSDFVCFLVYRVFGYRKKVVVNNLRLAFPEKSEKELGRITAKFYTHMCDLFLEMIKSLRISEKEIKERFYVTNAEVLKKYYDAKQGVHFVCGHFASYEWALALEYHMDQKGFAIYTPLANKHFDKLVRKIRRKHNAGLIPRTGAGKTIAKQKEDGIIAAYGMAMDQSPQPHRAKYWRPFLGVTVPVFTGVEKIVKELDQAVTFLDIQKVKRGYYTCTFREITDTPNDYPDYKITDIFIDMLEKQIRNQPEYYLWTHKRFKHRDKVPENLPESGIIE